MVSPWVSFSISCLYSFPSMFMYFVTIAVILTNRKTLNSSFFTLYLYDGAMNVFTYLVGVYMMRVNSITCADCALSFLYKNTADYFPMNFFTAMSYHMAYVQYSTTALISFNRLSVLWNHKFFEPIWQRFTWLIVLIVFALPFLDTHRCFYYHTDIVYDEESESYFLSSPMPISDNFHYLIPAMVIITFLSVSINIFSLATVRNINTQKRNKVELNFIIIMTITCIVQFLGCGLSVIRVIMASHPIAKVLALILPFVSDGLTLVQPWLLYAFSGVIRSKVKHLFGWNKDSNGNVMIVRSFTS